MNTAKKAAARAGRGAFFSLRYQMMIVFCVVVALVLGLVWFISAQLLQPLYNRHIYQYLNTQVDRLAAMIESCDAPVSYRAFAFSDAVKNDEFWASVDEAARDGRLDFRNCCVDIADSTLRHVASSENVYPCLLHESAGDLFGGKITTKRDSDTITAFRQAVMANGSVRQIVGTSSGAQQMVVGKLAKNGEWGNYSVIISTTLTRVSEAAVVQGQLMPAIFVCMLALAVGVSWLLSRWLTRPLSELSGAVKKMADGDYSVRVRVPHSDEIGRLAEEFNHMADQVSRSAQLQRELLANVSHDLRTPLTLIKGYAETVRDLTGDDAAKRTDQLNVIVDETDRLSGLVNSVMELSKVSSGTEQPQRVRFDMSQLCEEVAQRYEAVCAQNGCRLQLQADEPAMVSADPAMMERVLHNLLGNAMHHVGEDGVFILRVVPKEGCARVEVEDHGAGIAPEDLPYIFDRYYRSRSDAGKVGTGLGLSITKAILRGHGFRFGVDSTVGKGTTFWFEATDEAPGDAKHK